MKKNKRTETGKKRMAWILVVCMLTALFAAVSVSAAETVVLTGIESGMVIEKNQPIKLYARAADTASQVVFLVNSDEIGAGTKEPDGLYSLTWTPTKAGTFKVSAKADGITSDAISVTVKSTITLTAWDFQNYYDNNTVTGSSTLTLRNFDSGYGTFAYRANAAGNSGSIKRTNKDGTSGASNPRWIQTNINADQGANPYIDIAFPEENLAELGTGVIITEMKVRFGGDWINGRTMMNLRMADTAMEPMAMLSGGSIWMGDTNLETTKTGLSFESDTEAWYTITVIYDTSAKTKALYLDGAYAGKVDLVGDGSSQIAGFRITMMVEGLDEELHSGTLQIDDFSVRQFINEPASIALANIGSNMKIEQGAPFTLVAELENVSEKAESVGFYANDSLLGYGTETEENTYELEWTPIEAGVFVLKADALTGGETVTTDTTEVQVKVALEKNQYGFESWSSSLTTSGNIETVDGYVYRGNLNNNGGSISALRFDGDYGMVADVKLAAASGKPYLHIDIPEDDRFSAGTGTVSVEYDVYFTGNADKASLTNLARNEKGETDYGLVFQDRKVYYRTGTEKKDTGAGYQKGKWYRVKIVYDFENGKKDLYFDGKLVAAQLTLSNNAVYDALRFEVSALGSDGSLYAGDIYLDNFVIKHLTNPLEISSIVFKNPNGEVISSESPKKDELNTIDVLFSDVIDAETIDTDSVKLYRGSYITYPVSITVAASSGNRLEIAPTQALEASAVYTLVINQNVTSAEGVPLKKEYRQSFITGISGGEGIEAAGFWNGTSKIENIAEVKAGAVITYKAKVQSMRSEAVNVILVRYSEDTVKEFVIEPIALEVGTPKEIAVAMSMEETPNSGDVICGYVWHGGSWGSLGDEIILQ